MTQRDPKWYVAALAVAALAATFFHSCKTHQDNDIEQAPAPEQQPAP